jgi:hypothetical protein
MSLFGVLCCVRFDILEPVGDSGDNGESGDCWDCGGEREASSSSTNMRLRFMASGGSGGGGTLLESKDWEWGSSDSRVSNILLVLEDSFDG